MALLCGKSDVGLRDSRVLICPKSAPIAVSKTDNVKIITPEANQFADAWDMRVQVDSGSAISVLELEGGAQLFVYPEEILIGTLHIRQTDNGFKVTMGSCTLEAKPDGLYFNDKKVVLEDTT